MIQTGIKLDFVVVGSSCNSDSADFFFPHFVRGLFYLFEGFCGGFGFVVQFCVIDRSI
ncbi:hypothetical protein SDC9_189249 [bioreactor metagenome]|uniref:Uncharacterized protein n=1 Tax=bioreactor metagenome TaxID=1076179 RepID=A0A645HZW6_9ZZZZ